jgi:hypothetical protein
MANRRFIDFPIASTSGDTDIILIWQDGANKQTTKATFLSGLPENLDELNDVAISGLTNGQILRYDSVTGKWENTDQGNLDLNDLNDVSIVSPSNGQVLVYNSSTSQWENSSGGYVPYVGAVTTVDLGAQQLKAGYTTLTTNGSTETLTINHTSGSGKAINVTKGGAGEGLYVNKTSGSGNAATIVGTLEATTLNKTAGTSTQFLKADGSVDSTTYQNTADKGQPNGYASLDGNGKVPLTQINDALIGNVNFQGLWNASTNTPTLVDPPSSGTKGYYYIVSTGGTFAGITFEVGDWIISNGTAWAKVDNTDAVSSVFGRTGNVTASNGDYNTSQVTESGNLYYTDARSRAALSFAAGSGAYNSGTGVITIPTNNNQITNGVGYITSAALAGYVQGSGTTGQVAYWSSSSNITGESNLFWDAANDRLGIGTNIPQYKLDIVNGDIRLNMTSGDWGIIFEDDGTLSVAGTKIWYGNSDGIQYYDSYWTGAGAGHLFRTNLNGTTQNVLKLLNTGNALFFNNVTAASFIRSGGTSSQYLMADGSVSTLSNPVTGTGASGQVAYWSSGSAITGESNLFWDSTNDRLGIGTNTFGEKLSVYGIAGGDSFGFFSGGSGATLAGIKMGNTGNSYGSLYFDNANNDVLLFQQYILGNLRFGTNSTEKLRIFSDGNVLIQSGGTFTNNGARLQVIGTATISSNLLLQNGSVIGLNTSDGSDTGYLAISGAGEDGSDRGGHIYLSGNERSVDAGSVVIATGNTSSGTGATAATVFRNAGSESMRITSSGNVGIGTTSYTVSSGYTGLGINNATNGGVLDLLLNDVKKGEFYITSSSFNMYGFSGVGINLTVNNDLSKNLSIATTGNVLIGTTSDNGAKLQVSGGAATFSSSVTATSFFESSDSSLKTLVEDNYQAKGIDSVVAKLYIKNGKEELGYYAQDLQGVLPSAVSKGSDGLLNLSYREVHTAKIAYLEERIKQLENELGRISK